MNTFFHRMDEGVYLCRLRSANLAISINRFSVVRFFTNCLCGFVSICIFTNKNDE